jgi:hypothetical protein
MPHIIQRKIIKSKLPYAFESDDEDQNYYQEQEKSGNFESSIGGGNSNPDVQVENNEIEEYKEH